jgi:biotin carboxyl carrier protein
MSDGDEFLVGGEPVDPAPDWSFVWVDRAEGVALLRRGPERELVAVDGGGGEWVVTVRGRRIAVAIRSHRDRLLAETGGLAARRGGPTEVRATLPGLVVRVGVAVGDEVAAGDPLVTIEAMKMQNEIRAPRQGRVTAIEVAPGQAITTGVLLVRLADPDP